MEQVTQIQEAVHISDPPDDVSGWCPRTPEMPPGSYSVKVATTIDELQCLRPIWKKWAVSLEADFDYFLYSVTRDSAVLRPCVITVYEGSVVRAMLIGCVITRRAFVVVSFLNIPGPRERVLVIKKGARLGQPSAVIDGLLAAELLEIARSGSVDSLSLERISLGSDLFLQIQRLGGFLVKKRVLHVSLYSVLKLTVPHSGKVRRDVRRKVKRLDHAFPGQVQLRCFAVRDELNTALRDAMRVAVTTWQYYLYDGVGSTAQTAEAFKFFTEQGWLRVYVLYIKQSPCAYLIGLLYNNTFYCQRPGYDPTFARFSVGSLLTALAFENLAAAGVQRVDLGEGGQEHNRRIGCDKSGEGTLHICSPTLRGVWLSIFFGASGAVQKCGRKARTTLRLDWLSRSWRQFVFSKWQSRQASARSDAQRV